MRSVPTRKATGRRGAGKLRQPRLANMIADDLRNRILSSAIADGDVLPKQDQLMDDYGVSMPSVREALRILETEGLVTVLRGNMGGAIVNVPRPGKVAYMIALVLQSLNIDMDDVNESLRRLEPLCAAMAAQRADRSRDVVPALRARIEASRAAYQDDAEYVRLARLFHEDLVAGCGNHTMILVCGALETLWSAHVDQAGAQSGETNPFADPAFRARSLADHEHLLAAIEAGDAARAEQIAREHYTQPERHSFMGNRVAVQASLLHDR
jgi:DNA-binding FadR family transcriptional regulator